MKTNISRHGLKARYVGGASVAAIMIALATTPPGAAFAQNTEAAAPAPAGAPAAVQEVVVTASRIARGGFTSPTPTTVVGAELLQSQAATTVSDVLYELPSIKPQPSPAGASQAGGNYVNLRGLGQTRTLVLIDGARFVPTNAGNGTTLESVDTNMVPEALVERLDVVTGGASAAWGSDAIGGVVNIVLKKKLEGLQGSIQFGESQYGDAKNIAASLADGGSYASGRGQFMIAGEYNNKYDMPRNGSRSWSDGQCAYDTSKTRPVNGVTYGAVPTCGLTLSGYTTGGVIVGAASASPLAATSPLYGKQFLTSASSSPYAYGQLLGNSVQIGGQGGWISNTALQIAPVERESVYARTTYELTSNINATVQGSYARTSSNFDLFVNSIPSSTDQAIQILKGNPYIPSDIQAIMAANPALTSFYLGRIAPELGNAHSNSVNQIYNIGFSLDGKFGQSWKWTAYFNHGQTHFDTQYTNNIIEANLRAALDVVTNPTTGQPDCRINVFGAAAAGNPEYGAASGCTPANPFGVGSLANVKGYVTGNLDNLVQSKMDSGGATLQGEPFIDWAGPVSVVGGAEWRHETLSQAVSPISSFLNPPNFGAGGFQQANPKSFAGADSVTEVFGETIIPLLPKGMLGESLDFNAAARFTDYSTTGSVVTWKVGMTYQPIKGLLFRAGQSHDIRAASLFEQFGSSVTYGGVIDRAPGAGTSAVNFTAITQGNTGLKPEVADTTTLGITWTNLLVSGFSASIDVYKLGLQQEIGQLGSQGIVDSCYGAGTAAGLGPNAADCALINRASGIIINQFLNLGTISTQGLDLESDYHINVDKMFANAPGAVTLRFLANYVPHLIFNNNGLLSIDRAGDLGGTSGLGTPHWRFTADAGYNNGPLALFLQARFIGAVTIDRSQAANYFLQPVVPSIVYLNGSVQYKLRDTPNNNLQIYFNINNLLNQNPPFIPGVTGLLGSSAGQGGGSTNASYYDTIGRTFTVGARFHF